MIRIGIVGTGIQAHRHAEAFATMPDVRVATCMDAVAEKAKAFAQTFAVPTVAWKLEDVLDGVDALCVTTPESAHADAAVAAFNAGKHVLCEKPLATTMTDAQRV